MLSKVLLTPVDELVTLIKENQNCSLTFLVEKLKVPLEYIERWLVILEEYKIVTVKYKGFEGFVNLVKKREKDDDNPLELKESFMAKAKKQGISYEEIRTLWKEFFTENEEAIKIEFFEEAKKKKHTTQKTQKAWGKYREDLIGL